MEKFTVTHDSLPMAVERLLAKVEGLEKRMAAATAPPPSEPEYVTLKEARQILCNTVTVGTIYNWKHQGRISSTKVGRKLLFKRTDVEAMLRGNYTPTAAEQDAAIQAEVEALLTDSVKRKKDGKP